ncbi:putative metalloprotease CJM1_0395 family protein [Roseibium sp. AS2]|uniref:putative metalloprotease CJM1_0395 family protein n=1 Tax=Roseibium sp. AS2 TaxID=3135781 RepID=UPI00316D5F1A
MIGALLSNTPATLLKSNGVASETRSSPEETNPGREGLGARESQAGQRAASLRAGGSPTLTAEAVMVLQEADSSSGSKARVPGAQTRASEENGDDTDAAPGSRNRTDANAGGQVGAGAVQGQQTEDEEDDPDGDGLNEAEEKQVSDLKQRDAEVRAHEQAHARVGGAHAGAPSYTFQQGPDGKRYAIGGEVQIDTSTERSPEATIRKMQVVIRAATAPAEPSSQDLKVAQQARSQLSEAQAELRQQKAEELSGDEDAAGSGAAPAETGPPEGVAGATEDDAPARAKGSERRADTSAAIAAYEAVSRSASQATSQATSNPASPDVSGADGLVVS